jgi:hypothetical protein
MIVLNRRRRLSLTMIQRLHEGLGISTDLLVQPVRATQRAYPKTRQVRDRDPGRAEARDRRQGADG